MSLFDKIKIKLIEQSTSGSGTGGKNQNRNRNKSGSADFSNTSRQTGNKKSKNTFASGSFDPANQEKQFVDNEAKKNLNKDINKRLSADLTRGDQARSQYNPDGGYGDSNVGDATQNKAQSQTSTKKKTRKFFDDEKAKKKREAFQQGRKAYTDSKSGIKAGKVTQKGIIDYIAKARDKKQGTNANTKANREAAKVIAKSYGKEYEKKIRDKYETDKDLPRRRAKNQPSYAEIKKDIDARNPVKPGITGKPIPAKFIKTNVTDKEIQDAIKQAQKVKPTKTKKITVGSLEARDKAMKELDKAKIGTPSPEDIEKTEKLIKKQYTKQARTVLKPSEKEISQQQKIIDNQPKSKKFNNKSFDDFIKDSKKKTKQLEKEIKSLRTKSFVPPTRTAPNTNPYKFKRIKKIYRSTPIKTGTFRTTKAPKFSKTRTASKLAKYALGAYVVSQALGGRGPGILPAGDRRPEIVKGKGGNIDFTLAGKPPEK